MVDGSNRLTRITSELPTTLQVTARFWRCEYSCGVSPTSALLSIFRLYWWGSPTAEELRVKIASTTLERSRWAYTGHLLRRGQRKLRMNSSSGRRKLRIIDWLRLYLSICLLVSLPEAGQAQQAPDRKRRFLEMYARAYYPGRNGQIMLVPREGCRIAPRSSRISTPGTTSCLSTRAGCGSWD